MRVSKLLLLSAAMVLSGAVAGHAAEHDVKMLNMGPGGMFQLDPSFLKVQPGDTIHFVAKDKGHNVQSIPGMIPDGAQPFKGEMNKDLTVTLTKPGVYGVECQPHYGMGMVALIVVGDPSSNLAKAEAVTQPGKAKAAFAKLFQEVDKTQHAAK